MKIKVTSAPIPLLEFDKQSLIAILDLTSGSLTLLTKKCSVLHCNVALNVTNEKKGILSFYSRNMNKRFQ